MALQALLLLAVNIICVNLAGAATFVTQEIRLRAWWEADRAKRSSRLAVSIWAALLMIPIVIILFAKR